MEQVGSREFYVLIKNTDCCIIQSKIFVIRLSFHELHHESSLVAWISMILKFWKSTSAYGCSIIIYKFIEIHISFIQIHASIISIFIHWYGYHGNWSCISLQFWSIFLIWLGLGQSTRMTSCIMELFIVANILRLSTLVDSLLQPWEKKSSIYDILWHNPKYQLLWRPLSIKTKESTMYPYEIIVTQDELVG